MPVSVPFLSGHNKLTIELAEPIVYLRGYPGTPTTQVLRGEVVLVTSKPMSASSVMVKFVGRCHSLWPEGIGHRGTKMYHEKTIHEQNAILQSWSPDAAHTALPAGLHRWPFEFLVSNRIPETIEDDLAKVFYYVSATVQRPGVVEANLRRRREILVLRTIEWTENALSDHSLPTTSINVERRLDCCDAAICIEKSIVSSGTQFPISFMFSPNMKNVALESISIVLSEQRIYRLPEYNARRTEMLNFKVKLNTVTSMLDPSLRDNPLVPCSDVPVAQLRRVLNAKNAHIPLLANPFQYRYIMSLPNCSDGLNHSTGYEEIDIRHYLKIQIELSVPDRPDRVIIHFETPITILDCRLKEDLATLPTYEESLSDLALDAETVDSSKPTTFFACPCYLDYKKRRHCGRQEWVMIRQRNVVDSVYQLPPPPYEENKVV
ncbi:AlyA [Lichtheimia corymbifera JMRC:FSU:9682]|uniref:AlyA n=1 Tax=Lichtheimia corymbifera JMRC:FSU:9682 TaxID=1263082 RepID=A0A068S3X3_9FUNG|nr:AlyA [Lichtheimia corymbifera JMRC:FSU:9682]